jgi:hypothetical protein
MELRTLQKKLDHIDGWRAAWVMDAMDGADPQETFGMFCFMLSLVYRTAVEETDLVITDEAFTEIVGSQIRNLIANPPKGYRDVDYQPTPGCDCEVCENLRELQERKARAH